jgi:hypothetical protein
MKTQFESLCRFIWKFNDFFFPFHFTRSFSHLDAWKARQNCRKLVRRKFLFTNSNYAMLMCIEISKCVYKASSFTRPLNRFLFTTCYQMFSQYRLSMIGRASTIFMMQHYVTHSEYFMNLQFNPKTHFDCFLKTYELKYPRVLVFVSSVGRRWEKSWKFRVCLSFLCYFNAQYLHNDVFFPISIIESWAH